MYQTEVSGQSLSSGTTHSFAKSTTGTTRHPCKSRAPRDRPEARQNRRPPRGSTLSAAGRTACIPSRRRRADVAATSLPLAGVSHFESTSSSTRPTHQGVKTFEATGPASPSRRVRSEVADNDVALVGRDHSADIRVERVDCRSGRMTRPPLQVRRERFFG